MLNELAAWKRIERQLEEDDSSLSYLCLEIQRLALREDIAPDTAEKMLDRVRVVQRKWKIQVTGALALTAYDFDCGGALWVPSSPARLKFVKRIIEELSS